MREFIRDNETKDEQYEKNIKNLVSEKEQFEEKYISFFYTF